MRLERVRFERAKEEYLPRSDARRFTFVVTMEAGSLEEERLKQVRALSGAGGLEMDLELSLSPNPETRRELPAGADAGTW